MYQLVPCIVCAIQIQLKTKSKKQFPLCDKCEITQKQFFYCQIRPPSQIRSKNIQCAMCTFENPQNSLQCQICSFKLSSLIKKQKNLPKPFKQVIQEKKDVCQICKLQIRSSIFKLPCENCSKSRQYIEGLCKKQPKRIPGQINILKKEALEEQTFLSKQNIGRMSSTQIQAINHMHAKAKMHQQRVRSPLLQKVNKIGYHLNDLENLQHYIQNNAPIIIHIHVHKHMTLFNKDTHYRNLFQTKLTSGSNSTSWRAQKQDRMFDKLYSLATSTERVKYGAINFTNDPKGIQLLKQYGDSYFLLKPNVRQRCTVIDQVSDTVSGNMGTLKFSYKILQKMSDPQLKATINAARGLEQSSGVTKSFKQIQIHGPIQFSKDIERLYVSKLQTQKHMNLMSLVQQFCSKNSIEYQFI